MENEVNILQKRKRLKVINGNRSSCYGTRRFGEIITTNGLRASFIQFSLRYQDMNPTLILSFHLNVSLTIAPSLSHFPHKKHCISFITCPKHVESEKTGNKSTVG
jgi:hypothetical protein